MSWSPTTRGAGSALDGCSFAIEPGEHVALVGPTGAGKSTIAAALLGFVAPGSGDITVDGTPLATLEFEGWRRQVAWVPQHPTIFHGSVADNLRFADPDADDDRIRWAADATGAARFIASLPDGYATLVGEGGVRLSGGQRQLLALTRACVRDAPLVVWDEPVSHLDDEVHGGVIGAIEGLLAGRTAIVIDPRSGDRARGRPGRGAARRPGRAARSARRSGRGRTVSAVGRLVGVARPVRGALLVAAAAGMAAAVASVLLMVAAPYLISRATVVTGFAALAVTVTAVRALAIGRAVAPVRGPVHVARGDVPRHDGRARLALPRARTARAGRLPQRRPPRPGGRRRRHARRGRRPRASSRRSRPARPRSPGSWRCG